MKSLLYLLTLSVTVLATVLPPDTDIARCEAAPNCETYSTPDGIRLRFKKGMEPGSADYAARFANATEEHGPIQKRTTITRVMFGRNSINWGTINPCDSLRNCLYQSCRTSACDNSCTVGTGTIGRGPDGSYPTTKSLKVETIGQFNGEGELNNFVQAIVIAASQGQTWDEHHWSWREKGGIKGEVNADSGSQWWGRQTDFISVNKWYNGNFRGFMQAKVTDEAKQGGFCNAFAKISGIVADSIYPVGGNWFGGLEVFCDLI